MGNLFDKSKGSSLTFSVKTKNDKNTKATSLKKIWKKNVLCSQLIHCDKRKMIIRGLHLKSKVLYASYTNEYYGKHSFRQLQTLDLLFTASKKQIKNQYLKSIERCMNLTQCSIQISKHIQSDKTGLILKELLGALIKLKKFEVLSLNFPEIPIFNLATICLPKRKSYGVKKLKIECEIPESNTFAEIISNFPMLGEFSLKKNKSIVGESAFMTLGMKLRKYPHLKCFNLDISTNTITLELL